MAPAFRPPGGPPADERSRHAAGDRSGLCAAAAGRCSRARRDRGCRGTADRPSAAPERGDVGGRAGRSRQLTACRLRGRPATGNRGGAGGARAAVDDEPGRGPGEPAQDDQAVDVWSRRLQAPAPARVAGRLTAKQHAMCGRTNLSAPLAVPLLVLLAMAMAGSAVAKSRGDSAEDRKRTAVEMCARELKSREQGKSVHVDRTIRLEYRKDTANWEGYMTVQRSGRDRNVRLSCAVSFDGKNRI